MFWQNLTYVHGSIGKSGRVRLFCGSGFFRKKAFGRLNFRVCSGLPKAGLSASHGRFRLVLLCSQPDTVHEFPLHRTRLPQPGTDPNTVKVIINQVVCLSQPPSLIKLHIPVLHPADLP